VGLESEKAFYSKPGASLGSEPARGINKKIQVTKRKAYWYRDDAFSSLKIRPAFPGLGFKGCSEPKTSASLGVDLRSPEWASPS